METINRWDTLPDNEMIRTIYTRRSVRKYLPKPIDTILIEQILDAGRMAPSAMNEQCWKFYVLTNQELIAAISKEIAELIGAHHLHFPNSSGAYDVFHGAPVVIFITTLEKKEWAAFDIGMCSENMMLAARSIGLNSCPLGLAKFVVQTKHYQSLNIPAGEEIYLAIVLGYGNERPIAPERIRNNVSYIE